MTVRTTDRPDPARKDCGVALFSKWKLPASGLPGAAPARGRSDGAVLDAIAGVWERDPWPSPELLGYHLYTGEDGGTLLHHSQWTSADAYERYVREHRQARVDEIDAAAPGIERVGVGRFRHYRSGSREEHTGAPGRAPGPAQDRTQPPAPGCVVVVEIEFEGPDPERQRDWVDAVFEALEDDPNPPPGGISAHFHLSTDGTRVLNYAEWESARAHVDALSSPGRGIGGPTERWKRVQQYPGLKHSSVGRYVPAFALLPG